MCFPRYLLSHILFHWGAEHGLTDALVGSEHSIMGIQYSIYMLHTYKGVKLYVEYSIRICDFYVLHTEPALK